MKRILFVCSGNTCRSPLAEAVARKVLPVRVGFDLVIASAGTSALEGAPASEHSIEIARANGLDLSTHRARLLTPSMVREADLIVTMGMRHLETVGSLDDSAREHTFLLTNFSDDHHGDVPDPIGYPLAVYARTFDLIRDCVETMADRLGRFDGWRRSGGAS